MSDVHEVIASRARDAVLTRDDLGRYSRHLLLPEVGAEGQKRLKSARILVIGAGGLGSPVSLYLAAAGVGTLGLCDFDVVDRSNLQRQILFAEVDTGRPKVEAARERLLALAPTLDLRIHAGRIDADNVMELLGSYDIIVDGTDNFQTRYLVNDACVFLSKPLVYGSIFRFDGQASVFSPPHGPCYRCLFPEPPPPGQTPNCAEAGVLGVLPGQIGLIQATEALKLVLGIGRTLQGRLLVFDALGMSFEEFRLRKDPKCPVCGEAPTITRLEESVQNCQTPEPDMRPLTEAEVIDVKSYETMRRDGQDHILLDVRTPGEIEVCRISGSQVIPLQELPERLDEVEKNRPIVVHCKAGGRSAKALLILKSQGFTDVRNLTGGILAWIDECDPELTPY